MLSCGTCCRWGLQLVVQDVHFSLSLRDFCISPIIAPRTSCVLSTLQMEENEVMGFAWCHPWKQGKRARTGKWGHPSSIAASRKQCLAFRGTCHAVRKVQPEDVGDWAEFLNVTLWAACTEESQNWPRNKSPPTAVLNDLKDSCCNWCYSDF